MAGRGAATSGPRRRLRRAAALALGLGLPLLLLLAGAAAQAPAGPLPPAALKGKPKPLEACAAVTVSSSEPCQVKKRGQKLVLEEPAVTVSSLDSGAEYDMKPNQFAKDFKQSFSPGEGPTADVLGQVAVALDGVKYKKKNDKMTFAVDPSDAAALKALDAADACEVEFLTPCPRCSYADTRCAAGDVCPGGTLVSAECADRLAFDENPCACTALQELAALQAASPWDVNAAYCQDYGPGDLQVYCAPVGGVQLPTSVRAAFAGLAGALPPSLGELGSSLRDLDLSNNQISELPTEFGALTGLYRLRLDNNQLTGVPAEFRTIDTDVECLLYDNDPGFSCANVGAGTNCCKDFNCGSTSCYQG